MSVNLNRDEAVKTNNLKLFTKRLNEFTGNNRSVASIELRICNYRSLDPSFSGKGMSNGGKKLKEVWKTYIEDDPTLTKLAKTYSSFINDCLEKEGAREKTTRIIVKSKVISSIVYERSAKVKELTLKRARGFCELCAHSAPFVGFDGNPYLEVHHVSPLSQGGCDELENTIALCPNCHRKTHYGELSADELHKMMK